MLTLCAGCSRHVRHEDTRCPFCGVTVTTKPKIPRRVGRVGRAAILFGALTAGAVGCGGSQSDDSTLEQTPPDDVPPDEQPPPDEEVAPDDGPAPDDVTAVPAYGVPAPDRSQ